MTPRYTVARVATGRGSDLLTVVGSLLGAQPGEGLRMRDWWSSHPQYGRQFEVVSYTTVLPATIQGIRRYLGSGLIKGIGPVFAEGIVEHFDLETLAVIENEPGRLVEVPGLGPKRTAKITSAWQEQKAIKEVMVFLQGVGVSTSIAVRIYKKYAEKSIDVVKTEPYRLAADVWGIGFKTADTIAQAVEIPHDSPERVKAGLQYPLSRATDSGHCYLPADQLIAEATKILDVPGGLAGRCLVDLVTEEGVVRETLPGPDGPIRDDHPPLLGIRVPRRGHPGHDQRLDDVAAQPALHRGHPGQEARRPRRLPPRPGRRDPHRQRRHTALTHRLAARPAQSPTTSRYEDSRPTGTPSSRCRTGPSA